MMGRWVPRVFRVHKDRLGCQVLRVHRVPLEIMVLWVHKGFRVYRDLLVHRVLRVRRVRVVWG